MEDTSLNDDYRRSLEKFASQCDTALHHARKFAKDMETKATKGEDKSRITNEEVNEYTTQGTAHAETAQKCQQFLNKISSLGRFREREEEEDEQKNAFKESFLENDQTQANFT